MIKQHLLIIQIKYENWQNFTKFTMIQTRDTRDPLLLPLIYNEKHCYFSFKENLWNKP